MTKAKTKPVTKAATKAKTGLCGGPTMRRLNGKPDTPYRRIEEAQAYIDGGYRNAGDIVPSIAGLSVYLNISRAVVYDEAQRSPEFREIIEQIKTLQESKLINGGLGGDMNPTIVKLMLAKHGYVEKTATDLTSSDGSARLPAIQVTFVKANHAGND